MFVVTRFNSRKLDSKRYKPCNGIIQPSLSNRLLLRKSFGSRQSAYAALDAGSMAGLLQAPLASLRGAADAHAAAVDPLRESFDERARELSPASATLGRSGYNVFTLFCEKRA